MTYSYKRASTKYELVYQSGGTGGPYSSEDEAKEAAERLLKGGTDRWIAVIDAAQVSDLKKAKALWTLKRGKPWDKGPNPLPNVNPMDHYKTAYGTLPVEHFLSGLKRSFTGLEQGNVYDNLSELADNFQSLGRMNPAMDNDAVKRGAVIAKQLTSIHHDLLNVMIDANNLYVGIIEHKKRSLNQERTEHSQGVNPARAKPGVEVRVLPSHGFEHFHGDTGVIDKLIPFNKAYVTLKKNGEVLVDLSDLELV